ncbi:MAG: TetM/TetW/TetO/TetS family tetracycline resistance ribosomal protection protein, partial [Clostridia bacterium]|nr:TetM/TetW/TetO/TetS family tetracycline resistance ribosomal protection protein [Clostridia bacterium]
LGLTKTEAGRGLGFEPCDDFTLTPVLDYKMLLPDGVSVYEAYLKLIALGEEDPSLAISYNERAKEIRVRLMGEIQTEVLKRIILDRFGLEVSFSEGSILYKETVLEECCGAGHFEPLRHYAEVHLKIEPMPEGSGVIADTDCSVDALATNWQRLVMTHIEERMHKGVLTGSPLTDVKITLTAGRAHQKHTEGGDFRQATYRAIRQGLMKAQSVLLEPTFDFVITLPRDCLGKAMTDVEEMGGTAEAPEITESIATLKGNCPVSTMRSYATRLRAFTRGEGRIIMRPGAYKSCHNSSEIIDKIGYNPTLDERNTPNSVFCKNGSGYVVPWDEADALMHVSPDGGSEEVILEREAFRPRSQSYKGTAEEDRELMQIFEATYGKVKVRRTAERVENAAPKQKEKPKSQKPKGDNHIIIDGYNLIFAWDFLKKYADADLSLARDILTRICANYSSFYKCKITVVFDAYRRVGGEGSVEKFGGVSVVYTKHSETADSYIERRAKELAEKNTVRVVTNDYTEQLMVLGVGALRVSAKEFVDELNKLSDDINEIISFIK